MRSTLGALNPIYKEKPKIRIYLEQVLCNFQVNNPHATKDTKNSIDTLEKYSRHDAHKSSVNLTKKKSLKMAMLG